MSWVKLDDRFFDNPKVAALSDAAQLAYLKAVTYCARELTDGFVPLKKAKEYGSPRVIKELVPGLWELAEGGFRVHDYLQYNPTRAQVLGEREAAKRRMSGRSSPEIRPNIPRNSEAPVKPDPLPIPDPDSSLPQPEPSAESAWPPLDEVSELVSVFARFGAVNELTASFVADAVETFGSDWVGRAVKAAATGKASAGKPPWDYVEKTLKRWRQIGEPDDDKPVQRGRAGNTGSETDYISARYASG